MKGEKSEGRDGVEIKEKEMREGKRREKGGRGGLIGKGGRRENKEGETKKRGRSERGKGEKKGKME